MADLEKFPEISCYETSENFVKKTIGVRLQVIDNSLVINHLVNLRDVFIKDFGKLLALEFEMVLIKFFAQALDDVVFESRDFV